MPDRCVVGGCSNESNSQLGISLHRIPFFADERPEAKKRRKRWTDFVLKTRKNWTATKLSAVCSDHFVFDDYERYVLEVPNSRSYTPRLKKDDFGIVVFPTITKVREEKHPSARSQRQKKKEREEIVRSIVEEQDGHFAEDERELEDENPRPDPVTLVPNELVHSPETFAASDLELQIKNSVECSECVRLTKRNRQLRNNWLTAKHKLRKCRLQLSSSVSLKKQDCNKLKQEEKAAETTFLRTGYDSGDEIMKESIPTTDTESSDEEFECDMVDQSELESEETDTSCESKEDIESRMYLKDDNIRTEPKFITFFTQLLILFKFCHFCHAPNPLLETRRIGTMAEVSCVCSHPDCRKEFIWKSQPVMPSTKMPAGNFLLCFAILVAGGSASKVFQIFKHMGLSCISLNTFFEHQRKILFPAILTHWKMYQQKMIDQITSLGSKIVVAGDGRHDSVGHSAKYCAYTLFCCDASKIIHFELVQKNQAGSSPAMEFMGFTRSMTYIMGTGVTISTFISDRHTAIVKYMREQLSQILHYFDLWHLKKKITKVLTKLTKVTGGEDLTPWIKPCTNHLYWSACSTHDGNGQVIWAKFRSYLDHIVNIHEDLKDPLFNTCNHGRDIAARQWLQKDSVVYERLQQELTKDSLVKAIKKASPIAQTSCLKGFHSVVNHYAPKMIGYSFPGMYCRHIIAILHFNYNLQRDIRLKEDGQQQVNIVWPKFKNGEATVRDVRVVPSYEYVEEIFQTTVTCLKEKTLGDARMEILDMTPEPINTMLERQNKDEALKKRDARKKMNVQDFPPTTPFVEVQAMQQRAGQGATTTKRAKPHCSACKNPMKGHNKIKDCPKNRKTGTK